MALQTIFKGPYGEAIALRAILEQEGYETLILDENIKNIDPFMLGGIAFHVTLQASEEQAEEILRFLRENRAAPEPPEPPQPPSSVEMLGQRVRWLAAFMILAPLVVYFGFRYLLRSAGQHPRPRNHALTYTVIVFALLEVVAFVVFLVFLSQAG